MNFNTGIFAKARLVFFRSQPIIRFRNSLATFRTNIMNYRSSSLLYATLFATLSFVFPYETADCLIGESKPAYVLEGIQLPHSKEIDGYTLFRNGEGVRRINFMGFDIKVYVASFWTYSHLNNIEEIMACDKPKRFDFTFLRGFGKGKVAAAWSRQLDFSVTHDYETYAEDRDAFIKFFGEIVEGGTESVIMVGDDTIVVDQGVEKGKIVGKNFQKAFLSMLFGEKPVTDDLKSGLLGLKRSNVLTS